MTQQREERRRRKRVPLALPGCYMLESGGDYVCQTENVSATGILVRGFPGGDIGEWVVAHLSELGRVEGTVVRSADTWFAYEIAATSGKVEKLAAKIESLAQLELNESTHATAKTICADEGAEAIGFRAGSASSA